jgi:hypothetical protein
MNQELINHIQAESYYWENKATLLTVADVPLEVLEWFSKLSREYTKFTSDALGYEVEIHIRPLNNQ